MRCPDCGKEISEDTDKCPDCRRESQVTVLTPQEREGFQGITINQDQDGEREGEYQQSGYRTNHRVHVKHVHLSGGSFLNRFLITLAILAFLVAMVFVALPLLLAVIAAVTVISFIIRLLR